MDYRILDFIVAGAICLVFAFFFVSFLITNRNKKAYESLLKEGINPFELYDKLFKLYVDECYVDNKVFYTSQQQAILLKVVDLIPLTVEDIDQMKKTEMIGLFFCPFIKRHFSEKEAAFLLNDISFAELGFDTLKEKDKISPWFPTKDNKPLLFPRLKVISAQCKYWSKLHEKYEIYSSGDLSQT